MYNLTFETKKAHYFCSMNKKSTYQEQKEARRVSVLTGDGEHIGVWGNLKSLCEDMKQEESEFPSYWTIVRIKDEPVKIETKAGKKYVIHNDKIR